MKQKKRFIAGAICPNCQSQDSLMLYLENNVEKVECVDCGFQKSQTDKDISKASKQSDNIIGVFNPD